MGARGVGAVGYSYRPKGGPGRNGKPAPRPADWSFPHPAARAWDGAVFPTGQGRGGFTASGEEERPTLSAWAHTSFPPRALSSVTRLPRQSSPLFPTLRANLLPASDTPQSFFWWSLACPLRVCPVCQLFGSKSSQGPCPLGPLRQSSTGLRLRQQMLIHCSSGGRKPRAKAPAWPGSGEGLRAAFPLWNHAALCWARTWAERPCSPHLRRD